MNVEAVEAAQLEPNQSVMAVMGTDGDTKTIWDRTKPDEGGAGPRHLRRPSRQRLRRLSGRGQGRRQGQRYARV